MAYKPDGGIRDVQCAWTAARYRDMFPEAEIIISKDPNSKPGWDNFCKAKYINKGVERAKNDIILITDIDVVFIKNVILKAIAKLPGHCAVFPFSVIYYLNKITTEGILRQPPAWVFPQVILEQQRKRVRVGLKPNGMHLLTKEAWRKSGGYDERYVGWGSEDTAFLCSLITMNKDEIYRVEARSYHLWHPLEKNRHKKRDLRISDVNQRYLAAKFDPVTMAQILNEPGRRS